VAGIQTSAPGAYAYQRIIRSTLLSQLFWVDLIKWVSYVRPSIRTSIHPSTKSYFDFNEIWHVGRGRWLMRWPSVLRGANLFFVCKTPSAKSHITIIATCCRPLCILLLCPQRWWWGCKGHSCAVSKGWSRLCVSSFSCMLSIAMARPSSGGVTQSQGEWAILGVFFPFENALYGPYSSMNFAMKDWFGLYLLLYCKVWHNLISYY